jgi:hypothetical protein
MIVVRELLLGPKRFSTIQRDVIGVSPAVLTQRLQGLEASGIVQRHQIPTPGTGEAYELTPWGYQLEPVNTALSMWAIESPAFPWQADMSPDALILAMRAHARPLAPDTAACTVALHLSDSRHPSTDTVDYVAHCTSMKTTIERRATTGIHVDAAVQSSTHSWKALILGGHDLDGTLGISILGSAAAFGTLLRVARLKERRMHLSL